MGKGGKYKPRRAGVGRGGWGVSISQEGRVGKDGWVGGGYLGREATALQEAEQEPSK